MKGYTPVVCADGFKMSVQASTLHYCTPRYNRGPYSAVEVGFPSKAEPLLIKWAEDRDDLTNTVYGWVPADVVKRVIAKHGGMVGGQLPPFK